MENSIPQNVVIFGRVEWFNAAKQFGVLVIDHTNFHLGFHKNSQTGCRIRNGDVVLEGFNSIINSPIERGTYVAFIYSGYKSRQGQHRVSRWCLQEEYVTMRMVLEEINSRTDTSLQEDLMRKRESALFATNPLFRCIEQEELHGKPTAKSPFIVFQGHLADLHIKMARKVGRPVIEPGKQNGEGYRYNRWFERLSRNGDWSRCRNPLEENFEPTLETLTLDEAVTLLSMHERRTINHQWTQRVSHQWEFGTKVTATFIEGDGGSVQLRIHGTDWHAETTFVGEEAHSIMHVRKIIQVPALGQMLMKEMDRSNAMEESVRYSRTRSFLPPRVRA